MYKILISLVLLASLTACSYLQVHRMDIEQGNAITTAQVEKIHKGMSRAQVEGILGTPILANVFEASRSDYVYTYKPGYGAITEKYLTIRFHNERVEDIKGNMYSPFIR
ncbi:MAG: outer membrane protein assembly factor BamE [Gammaproteobacteria bacterium]|nr:outer membrane protein assembly factor BamE [Gammaproteobacteria bacterium]